MMMIMMVMKELNTSMTISTTPMRRQKRSTSTILLLLFLLVSSSSAFVVKPTTGSNGGSCSWMRSESTTLATTRTTGSLFSVSPDVSAEEALARTQAHLKKLQRRGGGRVVPSGVGGADLDLDHEEMHPQQQQTLRQETLYQQYILQSANSLKQELENRKLNTKGRKPDLARRLAQHDVVIKEQTTTSSSSSSSSSSNNNDSNNLEGSEEDDMMEGKNDDQNVDDQNVDVDIDIEDVPYPVNFATIPLSFHAATALHQAGFLLQGPSPIQASSLPAMAKGESVLLHAPTGSGKTLSYVLPITEFLWRMQQYNSNSNNDDEPVAVICTPTRELAAQVAGVASTLAPPNSVRLLSHPTNLMTDGTKDLMNRSNDNDPKRGRPSIIVGSAKAVIHSLYGNEDFPAPPTPKPLALRFLKSVRVLVLDEVDRLLGIQGGQKHKNNNNNNRQKTKRRKHEKPAAVLSAAVARHTLGKAQIVAASATVGRPLKRELARVLGLPPPKGPRVIVAQTTIAEEQEHQEQEEDTKMNRKGKNTPQGSSRLVTIPKNVKHFLAPVAPKQQVGEEEDNNNSAAASSSTASTSSGQLLIKAYQVIQDTMKQSNNNARILLVLARGFGISTQHVIGALQHFNCNPQPISLLDALQENALDGTDHMMQVHRQVSGATGVGQSIRSSSSSSSASTIEGLEDANEKTQQQEPPLPSSSSSLWVTGEDTIRGLHLDGLDVVLVVGRPRGPDEYTHIAGRTGRAGRPGKVVAVISQDQAPLLRGWETMLKMKWETYS